MNQEHHSSKQEVQVKELEKKLERLEKLNDFISNFEAKKKETTELEKELEKVKDMITPGQVGEA